MARNQGPFTNWSQYIGARLAAMAVTSFSADLNLRTAAMIGRIMHRMDERHRRRAAHSVAMSFPEFTQQQVDAVVKGSFEHFLQLAIEVLHTPRDIHTDTWYRRVKLTDLGGLIDLLNRKQPMLMLTGHLGNWEVLGYLMAVLGYRLEAIARPIDNPLINDWLMGIRESQGLRIITKWDATERMVNVLDNGGALGFIADQNAGDKGLFVPFFGRMASSYKSIALLAMNQNAPIVCGYAHRVGPGFRYEMGYTDIIYPDDWADQRDPLFYITARYNRAMELMIRRQPEQYLWMHRRWKSRPRWERQNKEMPKAVRRNLEELPWMTQDELERLMVPPEPPPC